MRYLFLIAFSLFLFGCSPKKRLTRLLRKHPELTITKTIRDTFIRERMVFDTAFVMNRKRVFDTFITETNYYTTTIYKNGDSLFSNTILKPDTFIKEIEVAVVDSDAIAKAIEAEKAKHSESYWGAFARRWLGYVIIFFGILFLSKLFFNGWWTKKQ